MSRKLVNIGNNKDQRSNYGVIMKERKLVIVYHPNQEYKQCQIYKLLGCPSKSVINEIGKDYNINFAKEIQEKKLPVFGRYQMRVVGEGVWFLEDNIEHILPWLKSIGKII